MQRIAVIGMGLAGLGAAFHLSNAFQVDLYDRKGIGAGASGVASGLMHPYPGQDGKKSWHADAAMLESSQLIDAAERALGMPVCQRGGIERLGAIQTSGPDIIPLENGRILIRSGITVFTTLYLKGLAKACLEKGCKFFIQAIASLDELVGYDAIVIAAGAEVRKFTECSSLRINFVKGQILLCQIAKPLSISVLAKGIHRAVTEDPFLIHLGSTYERSFLSEAPCMETAMALLKMKEQPIECRAGIRVTNPAHYFPIVKQIDKKVWVITALGSRGLLYHGYVGKELAAQIASAAQSISLCKVSCCF